MNGLGKPVRKIYDQMRYLSIEAYINFKENNSCGPLKKGKKMQATIKKIKNCKKNKYFQNQLNY